jgi:hypothetical protein
MSKRFFSLILENDVGNEFDLGNDKRERFSTEPVVSWIG